jgi:hypothetical protein
VDLEALALAGTTLVALGATLTIPGWYERRLTRKRHHRMLVTLLRMNSGNLPKPSRRVRAHAPQARTVAAASLLPDTLAAATPKHRRT